MMFSPLASHLFASNSDIYRNCPVPACELNATGAIATQPESELANIVTQSRFLDPLKEGDTANVNLYCFQIQWSIENN
ncbi:hypothetical protein [Parasphingorhabdus halotolerans]|uniref:Uncharacterized protein n=1 Tax=Parasphingorhabdus halotolerans TaxID=2725558 RepID=A0A6H2DNL4_9SPHN|nr:hypothetical protein [Parasphingorhabdus halotolerans]QJB70249.1 hypothetical protein HF685_13995 [Parasphingorhabdus halotolerans]